MSQSSYYCAFTSNTPSSDEALVRRLRTLSMSVCASSHAWRSSLRSTMGDRWWIAVGVPLPAFVTTTRRLGYGLDGRKGRALWGPFIAAQTSEGGQVYRMGVNLTSGRNMQVGLEMGPAARRRRPCSFTARCAGRRACRRGGVKLNQASHRAAGPDVSRRQRRHGTTLHAMTPRDRVRF